MSSPLPPDEREFQVSKCDDEEFYVCTSSSPTHTKTLIKIAQALDLDVQHLNPYTVRVRLPENCMTLKTPRKAPTLSPEQVVQRQERGRTLHQNKRA